MTTLLVSWILRWRMIDRYYNRRVDGALVARIAQHAAFGLFEFESTCRSSIGARIIHIGKLFGRSCACSACSLSE